MKNYSVEIKEILSGEPDPAFARRAKIIFENLELHGDEKVLEIGCGRGFYLKTLKSIWHDLEVTGIDLNQEYLDKAKKFIGDLAVNLRVADATDLPFNNKSFDRIIATEILEHIPDDNKAISEIYRILKPGGKALITVPNKKYPFLWDPLNYLLENLFKTHIDKNIWWLAGIWAGHERLYGEDELVIKTVRAGFLINKKWFATRYCFPFSHFLLYGIGKNLVEKGLLPQMNRFAVEKKKSRLASLFLLPIKIIDNLNDGLKDNRNSVNIILEVSKN